MDAGLVKRLALTPVLNRLIGSILMATSAIVLLGWQFHIPLMAGLGRNLTPMNPLTALCFILLGATGFLKDRKPLRTAFAGIVFAIGTGKVLAYVCGIPFYVDQILYRDQIFSHAIHNEIAFTTAVCFACVAGAHLLAEFPIRNGIRVAQVLAISCALIVFFALNSYALNAVRRDTAAIPMALNTACLFLLATVAVLANTAHDGFMKVLSSQTTGAQTARRLLYVAFLLPLGLSVAFEAMLRSGTGSAEVDESILVTCLGALFAAAIWISAAVTDKTEQRRLEAEQLMRQAKEEAERANLAKSEFLSRMSHELRTPLNAVLGFAQILELENHGEAVNRGVQQIARGGKHLLAMINEVLDLSRIETGSLSVSLEPVECGAVLREVVSLVKPLADDSQIALNMAASDVELFVLADRQRLKQICINLMSNAIKYNIAGGSVTVSMETSQDQVRLIVSDTGRGISPEQRHNLFAPFARLGAENLGIDGTGLGLSLSRGLAGYMNGSLTYEPNEPQGSRFIVKLKPAEAIQLKKRAPSEFEKLVHTDRQASILLVEDNQPNVELIQRALQPYGSLQLHVANTAQEGLDLAAEHLPNLILLDVNLPDFSGLQFLKKLRSFELLRETKVVVTSADATNQQIKQMLAAGALEYLVKPLDFEQFYRVLDEHLTKEEKAA